MYVGSAEVALTITSQPQILNLCDVLAQTIFNLKMNSTFVFLCLH